MYARTGSLGDDYDRRAPGDAARFPGCVTPAERWFAHAACKPIELRGLGAWPPSLPNAPGAGGRFAGANPCWVESLPDCPSCITMTQTPNIVNCLKGSATGPACDYNAIAHLLDLPPCEGGRFPIPNAKTSCIAPDLVATRTYCQTTDYKTGPDRPKNAQCWAWLKDPAWWAAFQTVPVCPPPTAARPPTLTAAPTTVARPPTLTAAPWPASKPIDWAALAAYAAAVKAQQDKYAADLLAYAQAADAKRRADLIAYAKAVQAANAKKAADLLAYAAAVKAQQAAAAAAGKPPPPPPKPPTPPKVTVKEPPATPPAPKIAPPPPGVPDIVAAPVQAAGMSTSSMLMLAGAVAVGGYFLFGRKKRQAA